ncbi:MAG: hypothetical protein ABR529_09580 [Actinomycetota bacterium]
MDASFVVAAIVVVVACLAAAHLYRRERTPVPEEISALRAEMHLLVQQVSSGSTVVTQRLEGIDTRMAQTQSQKTPTW